MTNGQFTFDLGFNPSYGLEDFLVAPSNAEAVAWLKKWPDWPGFALALFGPPGCGKSHLLAAFAAAHPSVDDTPATATITAASLTSSMVPKLVEAARVLLVDDIDGLADEAALFHLHNLARECGRSLVVASREAPARLAIRLPDLASRLAALPAIGIGAPDDTLLGAVMVKQFGDRQLKVGVDVIQFLVGRMERSFDAARALVDALDKESLAQRRPITVPLARAVLDRLP